MPVLTIGDTEVPYTLWRCDRATRARITVTPEAVEVVVPTLATEDEIADVLRRRRAWILEQTRRMVTRTASVPAVGRFVSGAKIPYQGRLMRLRVEPTEGILAEVTYRNGFVVRYPRTTPLRSRDALIESALRLWLRKRLREDVAALVRQHGEANGLRPRGIRIKDQKHLWGSCGADRIINVNWHLIFAPKPVLEYAVVHELCHLRERNHDPAFWRLVGTLLPDWERRKAWLDQNEGFLTLRRIEPT